MSDHENWSVFVSDVKKPRILNFCYSEIGYLSPPIPPYLYSQLLVQRMWSGEPDTPAPPKRNRDLGQSGDYFPFFTQPRLERFYHDMPKWLIRCSLSRSYFNYNCSNGHGRVNFSPCVPLLTYSVT